MPPAVDRGDMERVGEAVERERPRERNDVAAVDEAPTEAALALGELIEMNPCRVLIKPRRDLMLRLLDRHAVAVVDFLADRIVVPAVRPARERQIIGGGVDPRASGAERVRREGGGKLR